MYTWESRLQPAFELQDKMHTHTLGGRDWVGVMENISHGEAMEAIEDTQFGKPVKIPPLTGALQSIGLARKYRRVDLRYINSMRPSRHGYEKEDPFKEEDAKKAEKKRKEEKEKEKEKEEEAKAKTSKGEGARGFAGALVPAVG